MAIHLIVKEKAARFLHKKCKIKSGNREFSAAAV